MFSQFKIWCAKIENQTRKKIKVLRTDNETEFKNLEFDQFYDEHGIQHHFTMKKTPQ